MITGSRWVVTGAAGTIGTALRTALAEQQVELASTDIRPTSPVGPDDSVTSWRRLDEPEFREWSSRAATA